MGKLMSAFGGRLDAFRAGLAASDDGALVSAIERNMTLIDGADPAAIASEMRHLAATLAAVSDADLIAGSVPR